jgi:hypothetical protein
MTLSTAGITLARVCIATSIITLARMRTASPMMIAVYVIIAPTRGNYADLLSQTTELWSQHCCIVQEPARNYHYLPDR